MYTTTTGEIVSTRKRFMCSTYNRRRFAEFARKFSGKAFKRLLLRRLVVDFFILSYFSPLLFWLYAIYWDVSIWMHYEPWTDERMLGVCVILSFDCKMSHQMQSEKKKTQIVAMWKIKERKEHFRPVIKDDKKKRK